MRRSPYTRQTLGYPPPAGPTLADPEAGPHPGDVEIDAGTVILGSRRDEEFVFDNEKWAHPVEVERFAMARAPVTQSEYAAFVDDGGYANRELWSPEGWAWREGEDAHHPVYWRRESEGWQRRHFDTWVALEPHRPMIHVNHHEARAWCRWAGRRLPTEAEWVRAAATTPEDDTGRRYPWGDATPAPAHAHLDTRVAGCVDVAAHPGGDSGWGCRQMLGNVWEWTATVFEPFAGFVRDPYADYSFPWFGDHIVLRGGAYATRSRMIRNGFRSYYQPHRRDVLAGFRTCKP